MHGAPFATYLAGGRGVMMMMMMMMMGIGHSYIAYICIQRCIVHAYMRMQGGMYICTYRDIHPYIYQPSFHAAYMHPHTHIIILNAYIYIYTHM